MRPLPLWRWLHCRRHPHSSARAGHLCLVNVHIQGTKIMPTVNGTFTFPTTRKSGAPLALGDINFASLTRNGVEIDKLAPSAATVNWTDNSPLTGSDVYEAVVITNDGFQGDASNSASIVIAAADPASAGVLTATLVP